MLVKSLVGWKLVLIFSGLSWKSDNNVSLSGYWSPLPCPRYHVPEGIHLIFEEVFASLFRICSCSYIANMYFYVHKEGISTIEKGNVN